MTGKELKKLSRHELVDIIYQLKKNEQQLQKEIASLEAIIEERRIRISMAGSIAEAATNITHVFSTAQMTADLYLHEIACMRADTVKECAKKIEEAEKKVAAILADGEEKFAALNEQYKAAYQTWQQLLAEIQVLEERTQREAGEGRTDG